METLKEQILKLFKERNYKEARRLAQEDLHKKGYDYYDGWGYLHDDEVEFLLNTNCFELKNDDLRIVCKNYDETKPGYPANIEWIKSFNAILEIFKKKLDERKKKEYAVSQSIKDYSKEFINQHKF